MTADDTAQTYQRPTLAEDGSHHKIMLTRNRSNGSPTHPMTTNLCRHISSSNADKVPQLTTRPRPFYDSTLTRTLSVIPTLRRLHVFSTLLDAPTVPKLIAYNLVILHTVTISPKPTYLNYFSNCLTVKHALLSNIGQ